MGGTPLRNIVSLLGAFGGAEKAACLRLSFFASFAAGLILRAHIPYSTVLVQYRTCHDEQKDLLVSGWRETVLFVKISSTCT